MKSGITYREKNKRQIVCEQGNIVFVPVPFTDLSGKKKRPVLIVSKNRCNRTTKDFICCGITSNVKDTDYSVFIDTQNLSFGFLTQPSRIKIDKIFTLEQSLIIKVIGKINSTTMKKVKDELLKLF